MTRPIQRTPVLGRHLRAAFFNDSAGDELVEVAIAMPIFLVAAFGICQFAILFFSYINATYECRVAARYASTHSSTSLSPVTKSQLQSMVTSNLYLNTAITPQVTVTYYTPLQVVTQNNVIGNVVEVNTTWTQTFQFPYFNQKNISVGTQAYRVILR